MENSIPTAGRARHRLRATLLPSPMNASLRPARPSWSSATVSRSAIIWQGCSQSDRALITGTVPYSASSSRLRCEFTRATMQSTYPDNTRATSETGSRVPSPTSSGPRYSE